MRRVSEEFKVVREGRHICLSWGKAWTWILELAVESGIDTFEGRADVRVVEEAARIYQGQEEKQKYAVHKPSRERSGLLANSVCFVRKSVLWCVCNVLRCFAGVLRCFASVFRKTVFCGVLRCFADVLHCFGRVLRMFFVDIF